MAGSDNFAPVVMSGLTEIPPPMPAEVNSVPSQRFTLDHRSFEKFLAAAWVLQCLHDQLHRREVDRDEAIAEPVKAQEPPQTGTSGLPAAVQTVVHPAPMVTGGEGAPDVLDGRPSNDETFGEPVEVQQAIEIALDAAAKAEPEAAELETVELKKSLHSEDVATVQASKPPLPPSEKLANDDEERAWHRPTWNLLTANLLTANLRTAFQRAMDAVTTLRPALRVHLTMRALRTVAIATPVLLLAIVATLLLLETWRHEPSRSAQAVSIPSPTNAKGAVSDTSTTPTTTNRGASEDNNTIATRKPQRPGTIPPLRTSHRQVTDPATLSVVQGLNQYEISGLRRRATNGDASAAFILGMAYEVGRWVPQNCTKAARWVTTAAEARNAAAQYNLGLRYRDGDGVPTNRAESARWLRKAAARRYSNANLALKMLASR
jgi:TPR repeat protein